MTIVTSHLAISKLASWTTRSQRGGEACHCRHHLESCHSLTCKGRAGSHKPRPLNSNLERAALSRRARPRAEVRKASAPALWPSNLVRSLAAVGVCMGAQTRATQASQAVVQTRLFCDSKLALRRWGKNTEGFEGRRRAQNSYRCGVCGVE